MPEPQRYEMFLIGGSYDSSSGKPVVELFGRTRDGLSVAARYYGFKPYFELRDPTPETRERVRQDPDYDDSREVTLLVDGKDRPCLRVEVKLPNTVPKFRTTYGIPDDDTSVLACDIPFAHRFLYDKLRAGSATVAFTAVPETPAVAQRYSTDQVVQIVGEIESAPPFKPELTYLSFDIENSLKDRRIFCLCGVVQRGDRAAETFTLEGDERAILEGFVRQVRKSDPDIITGYNIGGYDLPLLEERAQKLGLPKGALAFGRDGGPLSDFGDRLWRAHGRVVADAWWSVRTILHPKQESLQFVSNLMLGEGKMDVDRRNIDAEWMADPKKVVLYCIKDAELALRILRQLRAIERAENMASVAGVYLDEGLNGRTSTLVDALLIRGADRRGIGVPPTHRTSGEAPIEGGFVLDLKPQLANWVVVLDFKSMYPSIIISRNICFTTLSEAGGTVAPNGVRFLTKDVRAGLVPEILRDLMGERDRLKRLARDATDPREREYFDGLQSAVKILMNSFYGVLASSFYRFTNKDIGAAITAFAREEIHRVIDEVRKTGAEVLYSDTDSVFVQSPAPSQEGSRRFGEDLASRFTREGITLEFQSVFQSFFSHGAKKRYVARQVWPKEEQIVRGYETRRSDSFELQVEALNEVFRLILDGRKDEAVEYAKGIVKSTMAGGAPKEKLVIARTVRAEQEYNEKTRGNLPFLRVYNILKDEGYDVIPGMKVAWIVVDSKRSPQDIEPYLLGRPFPERRQPDHRYYAERLAQTLARITEVFGVPEEELLGKPAQQKLGDPEDRASISADLDSPVTALKSSRAKVRQTRFDE